MSFSFNKKKGCGIFICGIFGANTFEKYQTLYNLNKVRGNFAFCELYLQKTDHCIISLTKHNGTPELSTVPHNSGYFLGHTQAPTSSIRSWSSKTSHPFENGDWIVAHNGIITNFQKLKREFVRYTHKNEVDSSIIPALLDCFQNKGHKGHESSLIKSVVELLEGTFACWIYNKRSNNTYLVRSSCTLFEDLHGCFSSVEFEGSFSVVSGIVYKLKNYDHLEQMCSFTDKSPFFEIS